MPRLAADRLLLATHNAGKTEEVRQLLAPFGTRVVSAADLNLPEPEETEDSFEGNARIKALAACQATGLPSLADDSGLCIDALGGAPGVYTANWAETQNGRDFGLAMRRAHDALVAAKAEQPWLARFHCTLVLAMPSGETDVFSGEVSGRLVWPTRGAEGHGYDPMFVPDGHEKTFAEMSPAEKNALSHRARAFKAFIAACFT